MGAQTRLIPALNHALVALMMKDEHLKNSSEREGFSLFFID
jgi:hypothetical protein